MTNNKSAFFREALIGIILTGIAGFTAYQLAYSSLSKQNFIVKINDQPITINEFKANINRISEQYEVKMGTDFRTENGRRIFKDLREQILRESILNKLMLQLAEKEGIKVIDPEIYHEINQIKKKSFGGKDSLYRKTLAQNSLTEEGLKKLLRESMILRRFDQKIAEENIKISEEDLLAVYESRKDQLKTPETVKATHILLDKPEEAEKVLAELKAGGDFAELAKLYSTDPGSRERGGDLGYFSRGQMVKEFEDTAFNLKVGEISKPVKTNFGYHIIKKLDYKPAYTPPLSEVKKAITDELRSTKRNEFFNNWYEKILSEANITYNPDFAEFKVPLSQEERRELNENHSEGDGHNHGG